MPSTRFRTKAKQWPHIRDHAARIVLTLAILLSFALQTFATQTHIHLPDGDGAYAGASVDIAAKGSPAQQSKHDKRSPKDDPANCPICQQVLIAGTYISPSTMALMLPIFTAFAAPLVFTAGLHGTSPSHSWHGRAPPAA